MDLSYILSLIGLLAFTLLVQAAPTPQNPDDIAAPDVSGSPETPPPVASRYGWGPGPLLRLTTTT